MVSRVDSAPVPATTGTRPAAASTVISTRRRRSAFVSVVNSPVLPPGTSPPTPAATRRSTFARRASPSMAPPSSVKGVMSAGSTPWKGSDMGHLSDVGLDSFGGRDARAGCGLHVPQLGEVVAGQVQVVVFAERPLQRGLEPAAPGARVDVAQPPAVHHGARHGAAGRRIQPMQVGQEALADRL